MSAIADPNASEPTATGRSGAEIRDHDRRDLVAWIPIVVPALAVLIATCAYLIGWGVLAS